MEAVRREEENVSLIIPFGGMEGTRTFTCVLYYTTAQTVTPKTLTYLDDRYCVYFY